MYKLIPSVVSALGLASLASAQQVALPEVTGGGSGGDSGCNGCYVVADVAGIAFGTETLNAVATNNVIVATGRNGSTYTTTSVVFDEGQFTVGPTGIAAAPAPTGNSMAYNTDGTTLVLNGVTLTSPTAYNVFTAYSVTSSVYTNGACKIVAGSATTLPTAYSVPIPSGANMAQFQLQAESSFIQAIGSPQCSPGGENYAATTQVPVKISTTDVTTTAPARVTPMPVSIATTAATTTGPTESFIPFSPIANASRATSLPGGTGTIFISYGQPTNAISYAGAARLSTVGSWFAGIAAVLAGIVA